MWGKNDQKVNYAANKPLVQLSLVFVYFSWLVFCNSCCGSKKSQPAMWHYRIKEKWWYLCVSASVVCVYTSTPLRFIKLCVRQPSTHTGFFIRPVTSVAHLGQICPLKHNWLCVRLTGQNQNRLEFQAGWRKVCKHKYTPKKNLIHVSKYIQPDSPLQHYKTSQA